MNGLEPRLGSRDYRIDVFRGIALVMIFINHMPAQPWHALTLRSWGFSDSAEVFVLLAGVASALAYGRWFAKGQFKQGMKAVLRRIGQLYLTHLLLFVLVGAIAIYAAERLNETSYLETLGFDVFMASPLALLGSVLTLTFLPGYLDILPLYVLLLSGLPLIFWLAGRHWLLPLGLSVALWFAAQWLPINMPNTRTAREWFFNPTAWQLLFVIGFTIGQRIQSGGGLGVLSKGLMRHLLTVLALGYVVLAAVIAAPWREIPGYENIVLINPAMVGAYSKTDLPLIRLLDMLAKLWLVIVLIPRDAHWLTSAPARMMALMGRNSLEVFAFSTVIAMAGGVAITVSGFHAGLIAGVVLGGSAAMIALAHVLEWKRGLKKIAASQPAAPRNAALMAEAAMPPDLARRTSTAPRSSPLAARLST